MAGGISYGPDMEGQGRARFAADADGLPSRPDAVQLRSRRNPRLIALGVLLACLGGLGASFLYMNATHAQSVVLVARAIERGHVIEAGDLQAATIGSVPGVSTVPASDLASLIGTTALIDLASGTLLPSTALGAPPVAKDTVQVGLKLAAGRAPHEPMPGGTPVTLIDIQDAATRSFDATVVSRPIVLPDGQTILVDVQVSGKDAPVIAVLAAKDGLVLVRMAER